MSEWEQPLNTHWVHMNAIEWVWTPIECAWPPLSHYWMWLTMVWPWARSHLCQNWMTPEHLWVCMNAFEWVLNTPWMLVSAREHLWVNIQHAINACECAWMPMSEWEQPLNTHWVRMNARLWVSIWKVWMRTSRVVNLTNLYGQFKLRVRTLASIKILCYGSKKHTQLSLTIAKILCMVLPYFYRILQGARKLLEDLTIAKKWWIKRFILSD
jgi:hypothetical protein